MAQGIYKSGQKINLTYQAVGALSNAIPVSKIYNSANASVVSAQTVMNSALLANEKAGGRLAPPACSLRSSPPVKGGKPRAPSGRYRRA